MSLLPPTKVGKLQAALHAKAKGSPDYRFYALYDKVYRIDVLWHAYRICQFNGGAPGVDGQTFEDIEEYRRMRWLDELVEEGSITMPGNGFVSGCDESTSCGVGVTRASPTNTCMTS